MSVGMAAGAETAGFPWGPCLMQLSGGTIAGMAVGYAMKSAVRAALLLLGSILILLGLLAHSGFITVNWDVIGMGLEEGTKAAGRAAYDIVTQMSSSMVGFTAGAIGGWRMKR